MLPKGLAAAILQKTKCSKGWVGVAKATVDRAGRVYGGTGLGVSVSDENNVVRSNVIRTSGHGIDVYGDNVIVEGNHGDFAGMMRRGGVEGRLYRRSETR